MSSEAEFERGALWALELLQRQLTERNDAIRKMQREATTDGADTALNGLSVVVQSVRSAFETEFIRTVRDAATGGAR